MRVELPFGGVESKSNGILGFFKRPTEPLKFNWRASSIVPDPKLRRLYITENWYHPLLGLH